MAGLNGECVIAQFSDVHCGDPRFDEQMMLGVLRQVNEAKPDLVIVPGDLTADGYEEQFREFARYLALVECPRRVVIAGNHDCRNVGYVLFEHIIGPRNTTATFDLDCDLGGPVKVVAVDSNIPDLNDGEVGRDKVALIGSESSEPAALRIFVLHHHLVSIPGSGRERNVVWDAGDVLQALRDSDVDLVLAGHKHVPYAWPVAELLIAASGTAGSHRTRGGTPPSFNLISVSREAIEVTIRDSAGGAERTESFPRRRKASREETAAGGA